MKVSGFTFIKNAVKFDYPIKEAISSILPICDEFIVALGDCDDGTLELLRGINDDKIKIIHTTWDEKVRKGGRVLALETDKAFKAISEDSDWAFYIQGDEVVHEKDLAIIQAEMKNHIDNHQIDGLLFKYIHFYGSYDFVGTSSQWYKNEIRIIRNNPIIYSFRDAQGFRKGDNQMLIVQPIDAYIYHYGWVKHPLTMQLKQKTFQKFWHSDDKAAKYAGINEVYDYRKSVTSLVRFEGTHPEVVFDRITSLNWTFEYDVTFNNTSLKDKFKKLIYNFLGLDFNYKNYIIYHNPRSISARFLQFIGKK